VMTNVSEPADSTSSTRLCRRATDLELRSAPFLSVKALVRMPKITFWRLQSLASIDIPFFAYAFSSLDHDLHEAKCALDGTVFVVQRV
jgi:hypothetical protein